MQCKRYEDFIREYQYYRTFLWKYRKTGKPFTDSYFHPKMRINETKVNLDRSKIEWRRVDEVYNAPLFDPKLISIDHIKQGSLGDCYFIAALLRIARQPELVKRLFDRTPDTILGRVKNSINIKCGAVVVFFHAYGRETPVLIDTLLPFIRGTTTLAFSHPANTHVSPWFCLVEKAYAKLFGSYSYISGGNFTNSIYSLFGYQPLSKSFSNLEKEHKTTKKTIFQRLSEYQKQGGVMSVGIDANHKSNQELKNVGLVSHHAYLLLKVVEFKGKHFYYLRNPWGKFEWKGDWSDNSPLWTKEFREGLNFKKSSDDGAFWMIEKDFLKYFTSVDVSRPIPTEWHSKTFSLEMWPGRCDGYDPESSEAHIEKRPNFALKINEKVPAGKKVDLFLLIERRSYLPDEVKFVDNQVGKFVLLFVNSNGKKLTQTVLKTSNRFYLTLRSHISSYKYPINKPGEILTLAVQRTEKCKFYEECSIRVTCQYDFSLYEIGKPKDLIDDNDNSGKIFTTVTGVHKLMESDKRNRNRDAEKKFKNRIQNRDDRDDDKDDRNDFLMKKKETQSKRGKSVEEKDFKKRLKLEMQGRKDPRGNRKDEQYRRKRDDDRDVRKPRINKPQNDDKNVRKPRKDEPQDDDRDMKKRRKDQPSDDLKKRKEDDREPKAIKKSDPKKDRNPKKQKKDDSDEQKEKPDRFKPKIKPASSDDDKDKTEDEEDTKEKDDTKSDTDAEIDDISSKSDTESEDDDASLDESEKAKMKQKQDRLNKERSNLERSLNELADEQERLSSKISEIEDQIDSEKDKKKVAQLNKKLDQKRNQMEELEEKITSLLEQFDEKGKEIEKTMMMKKKDTGKQKDKQRPKTGLSKKPKPFDEFEKPKRIDKRDDRPRSRPKERRKSVPKPKVRPLV